MAHPFNIDQVGKDILDALNGLLEDDIGNYVEFAERQTKALAKQAAWIAEATLNGELSDDDRDWFLKNLEKLAENFARTVIALTILTLEKAWNAIVGTLWKAINGAVEATLGFAISIPGVPKA